MFFVSKLSEVQAFVPALLDSQGQLLDNCKNSIQAVSLRRREDNSVQPSVISD